MRSSLVALRACPEALVVALARTSDRDAFAELVRRRQSWLRNLLRRLAGDPALADDHAQQTFLRAWRDIRKVRDPRRGKVVCARLLSGDRTPTSQPTLGVTELGHARKRRTGTARRPFPTTALSDPRGVRIRNRPTLPTDAVSSDTLRKTADLNSEIAMPAVHPNRTHARKDGFKLVFETDAG